MIDIRGPQNSLLIKAIVKFAFLIFGLICSIVGIYLCFHWYDWKLAVILFLSLMGNNFGRSSHD